MLRFLNGLLAKQKTLLREIGRKAGLEIRRHGLHVRDDLRLQHFLKSFNVDLVLDVGANRGQFAQELFAAGYTGRVVSFEALPDAHRLLTEAAARNASWTVAPRVALSDRTGEAQFHVTAADTASSLFMPSRDLVSSLSQARLSKTIDVPTARLDDMVEQLRLPTKDIFLKMDVQGAEPLVVAGAAKTLANARGVMTELSITPLYENQPSARDLLETIDHAGFDIWDIWPGYRDPKTYRLCQVDVICFRSADITARA